VRDKIGKHLGLTLQESYSQFVQKQFSKAPDLHFLTEEKSLNDTKLKMDTSASESSLFRLKGFLWNGRLMI
jgi:hypothetical protein